MPVHACSSALARAAVRRCHAYECCGAHAQRLVSPTRQGVTQRRVLSSGADGTASPKPRRPLLDVSKWASGARWLEPGATGNPYMLPILDVSPFTSTRRANSSDPNVVAAFKSSRSSKSPGDGHAILQSFTSVQPRDVLQGRDLVYYLPFTADRLPRGASAEQVAAAMSARQGPVRLAQGMEDKWDLYQVRPSGGGGTLASVHPAGFRALFHLR